MVDIINEILSILNNYFESRVKVFEIASRIKMDELNKVKTVSTT